MPLMEEIIIQKDVPAEMRDGTTLVADVYRPAQVGEYPVLLTRLPYGKDQLIATGYMDAVEAARHGYIVAIQDVRVRWLRVGEAGVLRGLRPCSPSLLCSFLSSGLSALLPPAGVVPAVVPPAVGSVSLPDLPLLFARTQSSCSSRRRWPPRRKR